MIFLDIVRKEDHNEIFCSKKFTKVISGYKELFEFNIDALFKGINKIYKTENIMSANFLNF